MSVHDRGAGPVRRASPRLLAAFTLVGCVSLPEPPAPVLPPDPPRFEIVRLDEALPEVPPPLPLAPRLRWIPEAPSEGWLVAFVLEPQTRGLPLLEAHARAGGRDIALARLGGGAYLGLVAAPLGEQDVPVEVLVIFDDGTRLTQKLSLRVGAREFSASSFRVPRRFTDPDPAMRERIAQERELVRATLRLVTSTPLWHGAFMRPAEGRTTSPYGQRRLLNRELRSRHTGLDIDGDMGDPVYASNSGRVALSRDLFYSGSSVYVDHGLGFYTAYFHLSQREVTEGQWVEKGELLGRIGATGRVTGPHLHWGVYLHAVAVDPLSVLDPDFARLSDRLTRPAVALPKK
ncbi:MAG: M23 family metallopeptidase [Gemmatimonadota bacterium]|nr:MAG: M23 family metallopeptidase [Gemmatimonadota bacterium]